MNRLIYSGVAYATKRLGQDSLIITILDGGDPNYVDAEGAEVFVTVALLPDVNLIRDLARDTFNAMMRSYQVQPDYWTFSRYLGAFDAYQRLLRNFGAELYREPPRDFDEMEAFIRELDKEGYSYQAERHA